MENSGFPRKSHEFVIHTIARQKTDALPSTRKDIISIRQQLQQITNSAVNNLESGSLPLRSI